MHTCTGTHTCELCVGWLLEIIQSNIWGAYWNSYTHTHTHTHAGMPTHAFKEVTQAWHFLPLLWEANKQLFLFLPPRNFNPSFPSLSLSSVSSLPTLFLSSVLSAFCIHPSIPASRGHHGLTKALPSPESSAALLYPSSRVLSRLLMLSRWESSGF